MITIHHENLQKAAPGIAISLAILVCLTLLYTAWQWYADWLFAHQAIELAPPPAVTDTTATMNIIPEAHLFGQTLSGDMPITSLQLRVTGIIKVEAEQNSALSKAMISIAGQPSKIYRVGDILPLGVKIYGITQDAVVLENDGRLEKLPLPRPPLHFRSVKSKESF